MANVSIPRDNNRSVALGAVGTVSGLPISVTAIDFSGVRALTVAIVDGAGAQITSFGGGTQYTDGGTPPTHPVGPTLLFNNSGTWASVSAASPLPVTGGGGGTQYTSGTSTVPSPIGSIPVFDNAGTITAVSVANPLPVLASINTTGLATSAKQDTGNTSIASIDSKTPALGQALAAASVPVVLTAAQITTLTPPTTVAVTNTGTFAVQAAQSGTWNITNISGTVSLPTGAATAAKQPALGTAGTASADVITIQGIASMTPLSVTLPTRDDSDYNDGAGTDTHTGAGLYLRGFASGVTAKDDTGYGDADTAGILAATVRLFNGSTYDRIREAANGLNSAGTGLVAAQAIGQFDDTSPTSITENQFGNLRISANRNLYGTIRDAAGNERGANVTSGNALQSDLTSLAGNAVSVGVGASGTGTARVVEANNAGKTLVTVSGTAASSGNNTLKSAGTNSLKVYAFSLTTTSATSTTCIFQSGAGGTELWRVVLQAPTSVNVGANLAVTPPAYLFATASATLLNLNLSGAQTIHYSIAYFDEA